MTNETSRIEGAILLVGLAAAVLALAMSSQALAITIGVLLILPLRRIAQTISFAILERSAHYFGWRQ